MAASNSWPAIEAFAETCSGVGSFGYGSGWEARVEDFFRHVSLETLLDHLRSASEAGDLARVDTASEVLKHVLHAQVAARELAQGDFVPQLEQGLAHYSAKVRALTARQLRHIGLASFRPEQRLALVGALAASLHDAETGIAIDAAEALVALARSEPAASRSTVLDVLREQLSVEPALAARADPSIALLRVLETTTRVCARDEEALSEAQSAGLIQPLLDIVSGDDILLQLNALRLVPILAATSRGLQVLTSSNLVDHLSRLAGLAGPGAGPDPFLGDEALRVMSQLSARTLAEGAQSTSEELATMFLQAMAQRLAETQRAVQAVPALELIGAFAGAQPPASLKRITGFGNGSILNPWMRFAASHGDKITVAGLSSIAAALRGGANFGDGPEEASPALLHRSADDNEFAALLEESRVAPAPEEREAAAQLGHDLFVAFGAALNDRMRKAPESANVGASDTVVLVAELLKQPFDEQQCAAYALLRTVAAQDAPWGLRALFDAGTEFEAALVDRTLAMSKQAKEWRFGVLEAVFRNPHRDAVLGPNRLEQLKAFLRRGPYLGPAAGPAPQVMVEGGSGA